MNDELRNFRHLQEIEVDHLGFVSAGTAIEFFEHPRTQLILRPQWARDFKEVGTVTVSGDSLKDEDIKDGDVLIVKRVFEAAEIKSGKLVVVLLPTGRSVVKRIYFEGDAIILRSSNPKFKDLVFGQNELTVEGIVKKLTRDMD